MSSLIDKFIITYLILYMQHNIIIRLTDLKQRVGFCKSTPNCLRVRVIMFFFFF